ncbi:unnamed protein product, partial [Ectocarpus sp. 12 AP-2014]
AEGRGEPTGEEGAAGRRCPPTPRSWAIHEEQSKVGYAGRAQADEDDRKARRRWAGVEATAAAAAVAAAAAAAAKACIKASQIRVKCFLS